MITFCLTSCNRPDLLERTLDSFMKYNTAEIERYIIVDDSEQIGCMDHLQKKFPFMEFYYNKKRVGMMRNIDVAYSKVKTEFIFQCEDDWEFYAGGFIEKSMAILARLPHVLTVWLRAFNDTNGHPIEIQDMSFYNSEFEYVATGYHGMWHGYSTNPGLRRTKDIVTFGDIVGDCKTNGEHLVSEYYFKKGFRSVILYPETGYVKHIGYNRTVI